MPGNRVVSRLFLVQLHEWWTNKFVWELPFDMVDASLLCNFDNFISFAGDSTKVKLLKCARPLVGRYVSIQSTGEASLSLCEVEIFSVEGELRSWTILSIVTRFWWIVGFSTEIPKTRCEPEAKAGQIISFNGTCFEFAVQSGQVMRNKLG